MVCMIALILISRLRNTFPCQVWETLVEARIQAHMHILRILSLTDSNLKDDACCLLCSWKHCCWCNLSKYLPFILDQIDNQWRSNIFYFILRRNVNFKPIAPQNFFLRILMHALCHVTFLILHIIVRQSVDKQNLKLLVLK